ncbi:hypothetical protein ABNX41_15055, partial [Rhodobacteraceae bacterium PA1-206B]
MTKSNAPTRRQLLARLGLASGLAYVMPSLSGIGVARASGSGGGSGASAGSAPSRGGRGGRSRPSA